MLLEHLQIISSPCFMLVAHPVEGAAPPAQFTGGASPSSKTSPQDRRPSLPGAMCLLPLVVLGAPSKPHQGRIGRSQVRHTFYLTRLVEYIHAQRFPADLGAGEIELRPGQLVGRHACRGCFHVSPVPGYLYRTLSCDNYERGRARARRSFFCPLKTVAARVRHTTLPMRQALHEPWERADGWLLTNCAEFQKNGRNL